MEEKTVEGTQVENKPVETPAEVAPIEPTGNETGEPKTPYKPVGFFSFRGRMDRWSYFVNNSIVYISLILLDVFTSILEETLLSLLLMVVVVLFATFRNITLMVRRFHDFGKSGYYVIPVFAFFLLIAYLPSSGFTMVGGLICFGIGLYILFNPRDSHENQYGPVPKKFISCKISFLVDTARDTKNFHF